MLAIVLYLIVRLQQQPCAPHFVSHQNWARRGVCSLRCSRTCLCHSHILLISEYHHDIWPTLISTFRNHNDHRSLISISQKRNCTTHKLGINIYGDYSLIWTTSCEMIRASIMYSAQISAYIWDFNPLAYQ